MSQVLAFSPSFGSYNDVLISVGQVPPSRIVDHPPPGTATEADVLRLHAEDKRLCELINGVLVEKAVGAYESLLAIHIAFLLQKFVESHDLGVVLGADGMLRLSPGRVRIPDVCFIAWQQLPGRMFPREPIPSLHPDLAVEVLSESNTKAEMHSKLHDYFNSGTRLVWYLDSSTQVMEVFTSPVQRSEVGIEGVLDGGTVLPGLQLPLATIFRVPRAAE